MKNDSEIEQSNHTFVDALHSPRPVVVMSVVIRFKRRQSEVNRDMCSNCRFDLSNAFFLLGAVEELLSLFDLVLLFIVLCTLAISTYVPIEKTRISPPKIRKYIQSASHSTAIEEKRMLQKELKA